MGFIFFICYTSSCVLVLSGGKQLWQSVVALQSSLELQVFAIHTTTVMISVCLVFQGSAARPADAGAEPGARKPAALTDGAPSQRCRR